LNNRHRNIKADNSNIKDIQTKLKKADIRRQENEAKQRLKMRLNSETRRLKLKDISRAKKRFTDIEMQKKTEIMYKQVERDLINQNSKASMILEREKKVSPNYPRWKPLRLVKKKEMI